MSQNLFVSPEKPYLAELIERLTSADAFAIVHRPGADPDRVEIFLGEASEQRSMADVPIPPAHQGPVAVAVPFRQIAERGFDVVDDNTGSLPVMSDAGDVITPASSR